MTVDFCANIENHTEDSVYTEVEKEVSNSLFSLASKSVCRL